MSDPVAYAVAVKALIALHLPIALIEAGVVGAACAFLHKVRPELLRPPLTARHSGGAA
jgi:hypothetical protein